MLSQRGMAKEQPQQDYRVRPLFYEHGFKIIYIEEYAPEDRCGFEDVFR